MAEFTIEKVSAFPTTGIVSDRLYLKKGATDGSFEIKMSNSAGNALIPLNGGSFVTLTGDQTIEGIKRFNDDFILGDPASDYVQWDNTSKTLSVFSQSQLLHKFRGGAAGALNIGQYDVSGNASINNTSNGSLLLGTNNTSRVEIEPDGDVLLKKVDAGTGETLMIEAGGRIVKGSAITQSMGSYTPVFKGIGGNPTYTGSAITGNYVKTGNIVELFIRISWSSFSGGSGSLGISLPNIPDVAAYQGDNGVGSITCQGITYPTGSTNIATTLTTFLEDVIVLQGYNSGGTSNPFVNVSNVSSNGRIYIAMTLLVS